MTRQKAAKTTMITKPKGTKLIVTACAEESPALWHPIWALSLRPKMHASRAGSSSLRLTWKLKRRLNKNFNFINRSSRCKNLLRSSTHLRSTKGWDWVHMCSNDSTRKTRTFPTLMLTPNLLKSQIPYTVGGGGGGVKKHELLATFSADLWWEFRVHYRKITSKFASQSEWVHHR